MEEEYDNTPEINSIDVNKVVESYSDIVYLNKKRKFQAETLGLPLPKHKCSHRSFSSVNDSSPNEKPRVDDFDTSIIKGKMIGVTKDEQPEIESAKGSNSYGGDSDSSMSSTEAKMQSEYRKTRPVDMPSTSSVNRGSSCFKNSLYSMESRIVAESGGDKGQSPYIGRDTNFPCNDFGLKAFVSFDEHLLEFGNHIDFSCLEHENDSIDISTDKELEDMLYSDASPPNNYVLSSGRWSVNQETKTTAKKLTIDKEFEQYFSMLML